MTMRNDTERQLRGLFAEVAPVRAPEGLYEAAMAGTTGVRQRPAWLTRTWVGTAGSSAWSVRVVAVVAVLALLALLAGVLSIGAPRPRPLPGVQLLYERFVQLGGGIRGMAMDGTDSQVLLPGVPGTLKEADWSPDGRQVVVIDNDTERMWIADVDGGHARTVPYCDQNPGCGKPAWSPDGSRIAFSRVLTGGSGGPEVVAIEMLRVATGDVTEVFSLTRPNLVDVPRWSPDGTRLVVGIDQMDELGNETGAAIAVLPISGGPLTRLTDFGLFGYVADWNPRDDRIVFSVQVREAMASMPPDDTWDLYLIHADGTGLRQLTHAPPGTKLWFPTWSRDGTSIIAADQQQEIAVQVDPVTGAVTPIGGIQVARPLIRP